MSWQLWPTPWAPTGHLVWQLTWYFSSICSTYPRYKFVYCTNNPELMLEISSCIYPDIQTHVLPLSTNLQMTSWIPPSRVPLAGYPPAGYPRQGIPQQGTPPGWTWLGAPLGVYPMEFWVMLQSIMGYGYPPRCLPHGILGNVAKHYGIWVPPLGVDRLKTLPSPSFGCRR